MSRSGMAIPRILFLLKRGQGYGYGAGKPSSGLRQSAAFVVDMLASAGVAVRLAVVRDNNDIDREVAAFRPSHAIIEALWVVPDKFAVLARLHPDVQWIVRIHSEIPFLAMEGIALSWIAGYLARPNVTVAANTRRAMQDLRTWLAPTLGGKVSRIINLPNFYRLLPLKPPPVLSNTAQPDPWIDIGCFGAIRPLKNQLIQALAAIDFANQHQLKLRFHVNSTRIEQRGDPILHNLASAFRHAPPHQLIQHDWYPYPEFAALAGTMHLGMQVSFTETFNIVAADMASQGVPVVTSREVAWTAPSYQASPTSRADIAAALAHAYATRAHAEPLINRARLAHAVAQAERLWLAYLLGPQSVLA